MSIDFARFVPAPFNFLQTKAALPSVLGRTEHLTASREAGALRRRIYGSTYARPKEAARPSEIIQFPTFNIVYI